MKKLIITLLLLCTPAFSGAYAQTCVDIRLVQSINVRDKSILIEFDTSSGGFQVVYMVEKDETIKPLEYGKTFSIKVGEKIGWGDGDHAFNSIELVSINEGIASIIIGGEHIPPATHKNEAYNKSRKCQINGEYHQT